MEAVPEKGLKRKTKNGLLYIVFSYSSERTRFYFRYTSAKFLCKYGSPGGIYTDEPTAGLDNPNRLSVPEFIEKMSADY